MRLQSGVQREHRPASHLKEVRYVDIRKDEKLDEAQMATWIRQAAALPGWVP